VFENDEFYVDEMEGTVIHRHKMGNRGKVIGVYARAWHVNGETFYEEMEKSEIDQLEADTRKGSYMTPAWKKFYNEMARKSVLKRLIKHLPKSGGQHIEQLNQAIKIDNEQFEPEVIEPKSISEGKQQAIEMQEAESMEQYQEEIKNLMPRLQQSMEPAAFDEFTSKLNLDTLSGIKFAIDSIKTVLEDA
jgi:recombination protein RecT